MSSIWIQIVGSKKTGKTTLIEELTRELVRRGRRVCCIKHTHSAPALEPEETDTARFRAAGAATTVLAADGSTVSVHLPGGEPLASIALRDSVEGDVVLAEGFKRSPGRKIALSGGDLDIDSLDEVVAVVGEAPADFDGPVFQRDAVGQLCDLIENLRDDPGGPWSVELSVDGRAVPLNTFVRSFIAATLGGMVTALDGVDAPREIDVKCRKGGSE